MNAPDRLTIRRDDTEDTYHGRVPTLTWILIVLFVAAILLAPWLPEWFQAHLVPWVKGGAK